MRDAARRATAAAHARDLMTNDMMMCGGCLAAAADAGDAALWAHTMGPGAGADSSEMCASVRVSPFSGGGCCV